MGVLQRWLDEPDEDIARFAKTFYLLTFVFMASFVWSLGQAVWRAYHGAGDTLDLIGPCIALFLTLVMYVLAIDGRRSYKARKATCEATAPRAQAPHDVQPK